MKTLFTINIKVTRPFPSPEDEKIRRDYADLFATSLRNVITAEMSSLGIIGLNVEVKVK